MKDLIKKGFEFARKNPAILYSLLLIVAVTSVIFFNTYYSLKKFEENTDALLQNKAVLAEDIFHSLVVDFFDNQELLQKKIEEIKSKDSEIKEVAILIPAENGEKFTVSASTNKEDIGKEVEGRANFIAWHEDNGIAFLDSDGTERFWNISKVIKNDKGEKLGITVFCLSLAGNDKFIEETIRRVYLVAILSLLIILLFIANHARLFKYALKIAKLEEVDKMKDDFVSMASHELKTPLTAIRGYADLIQGEFKKENSLNREETSRYLKNISSSAKRLDELVTDILEVSKIEQNRLPMQTQEVSTLSQIVEDIVEEMKINAQKKGLELEYAKKEMPPVLADPERIKQILVNLIGNAVKYTSKGKVKIRTEERGPSINITVADTGMGISMENMKSLFSKFYRIRTKETANITGTGLGLWISRELALKMEGDLTAESIEGVGSHFTLKLKKAK